MAVEVATISAESASASGRSRIEKGKVDILEEDRAKIIDSIKCKIVAWEFWNKTDEMEPLPHIDQG